MNQWIAIGALGLVGVGIPIGMMVVSALLRPTVTEQGKTVIYESGEVPTGTAHVQFNIQYYMVALLFVVFDVEIAFIAAWTVVFEDAVVELGLLRALAPMAVFLGLLVFGLVWAWRRGAVEWIRSPTASRQLIESES
jgi:NADH-quinone oxidoreductase subunit A